MSSKHRGGRAWALAVPVLAIAIVGLVGSATVVATDDPRFCATCHEMLPYYSAWAEGPHAKMWCIDCHVGPTPPARVMHKIAAMQQLKVHLLGTPEFPLATKPEVPPARCSRCHSKLPASAGNGFPHSRHTFKKCTDCHATAGHEVTFEALRAEGVLSKEATLPATPVGYRPGQGKGANNLPRHIRVVCSICHRMAETPCAKCHPEHTTWPDGTR